MHPRSIANTNANTSSLQESPYRPEQLQRVLGVLESVTPERSFLFLSILFGLLFTFITPPLHVTDEPAHFYRSYHLSEGNLYGKKENNSSGDYLPSSLKFLAMEVVRDIPFHYENKLSPDTLLAQFSRPLNPDDREFADFRGSVVYSPVPYLPQVIGVSIGRLLTASPIVIFYLGRLANLIVWISLTYFAIRITPVFKWVFLLLALTPVSITLGASLSADAFTHGLSFLIIGTFLYLSIGPVQTMQRRHFAVLILFAILLGLSKQVYVLLIGLYFLIPVKKVGSWKRYLFWSVILFLSALLPMILWTLSVRGLVLANEVELAPQPAEQVRLILEKPLRYLKVLYRSIRTQEEFIIHTYVGILGWTDTPLPPGWYTSFVVAALGSALLDQSINKRVSLSNKLVLGLTFAAGVFSLAMISYVMWSSPGAAHINGLQGRYFIPFAPLLLLLMYNSTLARPLHTPYRFARLGIPVYSALLLAAALQAVVIRFYVF